MRILIIPVILVFIAGCSKNTERKQENPIARVFNSYLYSSDLKDVTRKGISKADSVAVIKDYIEKWIRSQLLLNKAEVNLTESEKDVELQIESYRSSLLIYAYQQSYLRQNLDTVVSDKEIDDYYNENQSNFILDESLVKALFIKIPVVAPDIYKLRQWYKSDDAESVKNLEAYCFSHAAAYDRFNESWIKFSEVLRMMPSVNNYSESGILFRKFLETRDEKYYYFLRINESAAQGTVSPLEVVRNDIYYIILNKRKIKLINELESSIYSDAQNRKYFTIY
jgi:hypothetical protein